MQDRTPRRGSVWCAQPGKGRRQRGFGFRSTERPGKDARRVLFAALNDFVVHKSGDSASAIGEASGKTRKVGGPGGVRTHDQRCPGQVFSNTPIGSQPLKPAQTQV